jgi:hypothetical protein
VTTYEEYRQLRKDCGYDEHAEMVEEVWNGCDAESQQNMLQQYRDMADRRAVERAAFPPGWGAW